LVCQDEFFMNNLLDVKENCEHALIFALHLSLGHGEFGFSVYISCFFSMRVCLMIARSSVAIFLDLHKIWCCSFVGSIA
jgi:hypothetical protein